MGILRFIFIGPESAKVVDTDDTNFGENTNREPIKEPRRLPGRKKWRRRRSGLSWKASFYLAATLTGIGLIAYAIASDWEAERYAWNHMGSPRIDFEGSRPSRSPAPAPSYRPTSQPTAFAGHGGIGVNWAKPLIDDVTMLAER